LGTPLESIHDFLVELPNQDLCHSLLQFIGENTIITVALFLAFINARGSDPAELCAGEAVDDGSGVANGDRERMVLLNPSKMRHGIPAKRLVRPQRQPFLIRKCHGLLRTNACLSVIADLQGRLGRCNFLFNQVCLSLCDQG
ncbi:MAG: hypothetical protein ABI618_19770, partial [Nitrospirota bacterium]